MTDAEILALAQSCGLVVSRQHIDRIYVQEILKFARQAVEIERAACLGLVYGHCGSDNEAERIASAIRARSITAA